MATQHDKMRPPLQPQKTEAVDLTEYDETAESEGEVIRGLTADDWMDNDYGGENCISGEAPAHLAPPTAEALNSSTRMRRRRADRAQQQQQQVQQRSPHQSVDDHSYTSPVTSAASASGVRGSGGGGGGGSPSSAVGGGGSGPGGGGGPPSSSLGSRGSPPGALDSSSSTNATGPEDEFDAFGRSAAAQLRRMPLRMALRAQLQIQSFLTEARLYACSGYEDFPEDN